MSVPSIKPTLRKYVGRVKYSDGKLSQEYVDWFQDDMDAKRSYRIMMEQMGYDVKSIDIQDRKVIVEIQ